jgi:bacterioferritin-associated ferredoxin
MPPARDPANEPAEGPPRVVCRCLGVASPRIAAACRAGCRDLGAVREATGAGSGCGTCRREVEEILRALAGNPVPAGERIANARLCAGETLRRVESALDIGVLRALPPGCELELIGVSGLTVELRFVSGGDEALEREAASRLRKLVCDDLCVVFV